MDVEGRGFVIRRIVLENFMSHGHTVLEVSDGLTVLVGPNNCGKSAVVEALRTLCENDNADHLLKHGEKQCAVTVETDDGHVMAWKRKSSGTVWYEFDGEPQHRLKGKVPEKLHELLKLGRVETPHGDSIDVHFGRQKAPIFLLEEEAADRKAAAFFSSTSDAEKILRMQQRHRDKRRNARAMQKELGAELARAEKTLASLAPLEGTEPALVQAEELYRVIQEEAKAIRELGAAIGRLESVREWQSKEAARCDGLDKLKLPPEQQDVSKLERHVQRIQQEGRSASRAVEMTQALSSLTPVPALAEVGGLEKSVHAISKYVVTVTRYEQERSVLRSLSATPELSDVDALVALGKKLKSASADHERWTHFRACCCDLREVPDIADEQPLRELTTRVDAARQAHSSAKRVAKLGASLQSVPTLEDPAALHSLLERAAIARQQLADRMVESKRTDADLASVEAEASNWAMQNPTCPLCGGTVDPKKVLAPEHQHA